MEWLQFFGKGFYIYVLINDLMAKSKGVGLILEVIVLVYFLTAVLNDLWDAAQGINSSITGATLFQSVLFVVLLIAVIMQVLDSAGIKSK